MRRTDEFVDLDAVLDSYEGLWVNGPSPPNLIEFAQSIPAQQEVSESELHAFWFELATIDMEMRFRTGKRNLRRNSGWYAEHFAPQRMSEQSLEDLTLQEMVIRCHWGDRPQIAAFVHEHYPDRTSDFHDRYAARILDRIDSEFPMEAVVTVDDEQGTQSESGKKHPPRTEVHLLTPCIVGRQKSSEPAPVRLCRDAETDHHRLIVVDRKRDSVSRMQLALKRLAVDRLQVTPISTKISTLVDGARLAPGKPVVFPIHYLGIQIGFGPVLITVRLV